MIPGDLFYRCFDDGFTASAPADAVSRIEGRPGRYRVRTPAGEVRAWFRVNPKGSGVPHQPGEFWPRLVAPSHLRHPTEEDDGTISWYQYTSADQLARIQSFRREVAARAGGRATDGDDVFEELAGPGAPVVELLAEQAPEPRFPHTRLFYLDADDAESWGRLFGEQLTGWIEAFADEPETLARYMWRVHWDEA